MAKKFMFVCFGILALAGAYAVGASNSVAQVGGAQVVASYMPLVSAPATVVVTADGDFYARVGTCWSVGGAAPTWSSTGNWTFMGNCFDGVPVANQQNSLGGVKTLFR